MIQDEEYSILKGPRAKALRRIPGGFRTEDRGHKSERINILGRQLWSLCPYTTVSGKSDGHEARHMEGINEKLLKLNTSTDYANRH